MLLPWEYGIRNLSRRPLRTVLTLLALSIVVLLVLVVVGFIRGLERSLATSGKPNVVLVYSVNAEQNIENSVIPARTSELLTASVSGIREYRGAVYASPEIYLGTRMGFNDGKQYLGLVRGVTPEAALVREQVLLTEGHWPDKYEVVVGRLAAAKLGCDEAELQIGKQIQIEGQAWEIAGKFAAGGTAYESEIWCRLEDLQQATQRQDLTLVAVELQSGKSPAELGLFCKQRTDLELQATEEQKYYRSLQQHYQPMRTLAWLIVSLVSGAGVFAGLNMMYGAVAGRAREIATLQAIGFRRRAVLVSILQEGLLLAAAASLIAGTVALLWVDGWAVRFTMGAFTLRVDSPAILIGCGSGLALGILGALPPAIKALRADVASGLKAV